jgi:hypothetical protein
MKIFKPYLHTIFLILVFCSPLSAQDHSPQDTVKQWIKVYGVDQVKASELTASRFREGKSKKAWAKESYKQLKKTKYKHLGGRVLNETIKGFQATVTLRSKIETIAGIKEQTEVYTLFILFEKWLISEIIVKDEVEIEELEERGMFL